MDTMSRTWEYIVDTFTIIGCTRAAGDLSRMGQDQAARELMLKINSIKNRRQAEKAKESK
jgi:hypothetical protein